MVNGNKHITQCVIHCFPFIRYSITNTQIVVSMVIIQCTPITELKYTNE